MAHEVPILNHSLLAGADFSTKQYLFVKLSASADDTVSLGAANSDDVIGVIQNNPTSGNPTTVMLYGITKVVCGGSVTRGDALMSDTAGKAITRTAGNPSAGFALESGSTNGLISMFLLKSVPGVRFSVISFQLDLAAIATGNVFTYTPGFAGRIISASFVTNVVAATANKLATLTCGVGAVAVTNAASAGIALTTANCTPVGNEVKHAAITAANTFSASQTVTVIASAVTTFVEGSGTVLITIAA